ncbi:MAG: hypothetical protein VBE63_22395 [Lamprobacter sp.]|uniref:hypothetical protein n=1 Tax=Lamprobacter sp. TaxID=3100796 RepID=UPI002B260322|nr:hypothetical protein [Lamprobacter sp.]MEA3642667.1 hypothetical protein [Lamprobacter sp.]
MIAGLAGALSASPAKGALIFESQGDIDTMNTIDGYANLFSIKNNTNSILSQIYIDLSNYEGILDKSDYSVTLGTDWTETGNLNDRIYTFQNQFFEGLNPGGTVSGRLIYNPSALSNLGFALSIDNYNQVTNPQGVGVLDEAGFPYFGDFVLTDFNPLSYPQNPVPVGGTIGLLVAGVAGMLGVGRRRRAVPGWFATWA